MRPRIRTLKPEMWQDEKVGDLSHGARLLFIGLISMADDEGRLRELPTAILGHVFPYDNVTPAKVTRWLAEIEQTGMIVRYEADGKRYVAFPQWAKHQRVDRPNPSDLPPPPDDSPNNRRTFDDQSRSTRASAVRSDPILSDPSFNQGETEAQGASASDTLPDDFPGELSGHIEAALPVLVDLATRHGAKAVSRRSLAATMMAPQRRHKPFVRCAYDFAAWADGKAKLRKDVLAGYRNWLDNTDDLACVETIAPGAGGQSRGPRAASLQRMDAWRNAPEYQQRGAA